jgi:trimethylamine--corrinoid protein Co-methyltransferase
MLTYAELLTPSEVLRVHEASLEILETVGMIVRNAQAREIYARHGCLVDEQTTLVKFPRAVIEEFRASLPPKFTFHARDPRFDRTLPDHAPVIITGSSAPNLIDPVSG